MQESLLIAESLLKDPSLVEAKDKILKTIEAYRKKITTVKAPDPQKKQSYEKSIQEMEAMRGMPLWFPYLGSGMGNGALVELADGSIKYDFISGIGTTFSHSYLPLIASGLDAAIQNSVMQGNLQQNRDSYELLELLTKGSGLPHCFLTTSGAMANENALKLAFRHQKGSSRVLVFERAFVGRTLALAQMTDKPAYREGLPNTLYVDYIPFFDPRNPEGSQKKALESLQTHLRRYPERYACMCFELIQGEAGYYPASREFFLSLMQELRKQHVPILIDEIQTFGRTDHLFAFQHFGLEEYADIVTVGKLSQTCATLFKTEFQPKPGLIAQTFTSSTQALWAAKTILKELMHGSFLGENGKIMQMGKYFKEQLEKLSRKFPEKVKGPFGYGSMVAFTHYNGEMAKAVTLVKALFDAGLICFLGGEHPTRIRFHLPIAGVTLHDLDEAVKILETVLNNI